MDLDKEQEIPVLISLHEKYFEEMKKRKQAVRI
jgi:hypothetical protein